MKKLTQNQKDEIVKISQEFSQSLYEVSGGSINNSGWIIVDPLSGYLNACGYKNTCSQIPGNNKHPQVLILEFQDGSKFIPAGADLKPIHDEFKNWMWI